MHKILLSCLLLLFISSTSAKEFSKNVANIGPWTVKYYSDENIALAIGGRCAAVQYGNSADLMLTADFNDPEDSKTLNLFTSFGGIYNNARVWIDDGSKFDHYLNVYNPDRHGHSGVFPISDLSGKKLFVRFEIGRLDAGRYEFSIGNLSEVSKYLHQKKCVFEIEKTPLVTNKQLDSIEIGDTYESVTSKLGVADNSYIFTEDNTEGYEYKLGKKTVIIVFDSQKKVTDKVIKPK
jgi:hypothetical protein